eukprot:GHVH01008981.1.p1 GENE.GHVH01008981.1~~GHVH01008981.1.p1  ORF type:complete len:393 (+),score=36.45 GHVH01008981.1:367-1545(+)
MRPVTNSNYGLPISSNDPRGASSFNRSTTTATNLPTQYPSPLNQKRVMFNDELLLNSSSHEDSIKNRRVRRSERSSPRRQPEVTSPSTPVSIAMQTAIQVKDSLHRLKTKIKEEYISKSDMYENHYSSERKDIRCAPIYEDGTPPYAGNAQDMWKFKKSLNSQSQNVPSTVVSPMEYDTERPYHLRHLPQGPAVGAGTINLIPMTNTLLNPSIDTKGYEHPYCIEHCTSCKPMDTNVHPGEVIRYREHTDDAWNRLVNLNPPLTDVKCPCGKPALCDCVSCRRMILRSLDPRFDFRYEDDKWENNKIVRNLGNAYLKTTDGLCRVIEAAGKVPFHRKRKRQKQLMYHVYRDQMTRNHPLNYHGEHSECKAVQLGLKPKGYDCLACSNCTPCC